MAKTIVFRKEFEDKLKKLRIKTEFVNEIRLSIKHKRRGCMAVKGDSAQEIVGELNSQPSWGPFVDKAFIWAYTAKRYDYWRRIAGS